MKIGKKEGEGRQDTLKNFLLRYQSTPHPDTSTTPADLELFLNRPLRTKLDLLRPNYREIIGGQQEKQKTYMYHDVRRAKFHI